MEQALDMALSSKPFVKGALIADQNGLCIAAKGELGSELSGRFCSISKTAGTLDSDQAAPSVLIETGDRNILVKEYDSLTVVLRIERST